MKAPVRSCKFHVFLTAGLICLPSWVSWAQPKSGLREPPELDPAEGRRQARALVNDLLRLKPEQDLVQPAVLKIRDASDQQVQIPVQLEVVCTPTNFHSIYRTTGGAGPGMKLTIVRQPKHPNEYYLSEPLDAPARKLSANELWLPFAGSDFCAADLGLEFLHWPEQRVVRNLMRKSVYCHMLESINPSPVPGGYAKVLSWIGANRPGEMILVHAEAYDAQGRLLKLFDPTKLEKIEGIHQLEEMEIRNRQAGTNTKIQFNLKEQRLGQ